MILTLVTLSDDTMTRMEVMQLITQEAMYRYKAEMEMMMQPIMEEREAVKAAFGTEFDIDHMTHSEASYVDSPDYLFKPTLEEFEE